MNTMPVGSILIFFEGGRYWLKKFDGVAWLALREVTEAEALAMSY